MRSSAPPDTTDAIPPGTVLPVTLRLRRVGAGAPFDPAALTPAEEADCGRRLRPADAALCRESRFLLRRALSAHLDLPPAAIAFARAPTGEVGGKPCLAAPDAPPLRFNLSHSAGLTVLAVVEDAAAEPGVDVEDLDRRVGPGLFEAALAPAERAALTALPEAARGTAFLRLWTMKEAVLKAAGIGLGAPLPELVCRLDPPALLSLPPGLGDPADYALLPLAFTTSHVGALALYDPVRRRRPLPVWHPPL
jgi:4'-phosphopantetheinyl transferase